MTNAKLTVSLLDQKGARDRYKRNFERCSALIIKLVTKLLQEAGVTNGSFDLRYVRFKATSKKGGITSVYQEKGLVYIVIDDEFKTRENTIFSFRPPNKNVSEFLANLQDALERLHTKQRRGTTLTTMIDSAVDSVVTTAAKAEEAVKPTNQVTSDTTTILTLPKTAANSIVDELEFEILEIEEALALKKQAIEKSKEEHRLAAASVSEASTKSEPLQDELIQIKELQATLEREIAEKTAELSALKRSTEPLKERLQTLVASRKKLEEEETRCKLAVRSATEELRALQEQLCKTQKSLEEERQKLAKKAGAAAAIERLKAEGIDIPTIRELLASP